MSSIEQQSSIDQLPHTLAQASEDFHQHCLQHLAKAQKEGRTGWNEADVSIERLQDRLDKAILERDWTSVSNYAMMLNYHRVV